MGLLSSFGCIVSGFSSAGIMPDRPPSRRRIEGSYAGHTV